MNFNPKTLELKNQPTPFKPQPETSNSNIINPSPERSSNGPNAQPTNSEPPQNNLSTTTPT